MADDKIDTICELAAEIKRLRQALQDIADERLGSGKGLVKTNIAKVALMKKLAPELETIIDIAR